MDKKNLYIEIYKCLVLTGILIILIIFYVRLDKPLVVINKGIDKYQSLISNAPDESWVENNKGKEIVSHGNSNKDELISELTQLAAMAQQYYKKPVVLGGGENSFKGWNVPQNMKKTGAGSYTAMVTNDEITLTGKGNTTIGKDTVQVTMRVNPNKIVYSVIGK